MRMTHELQAVGSGEVVYVGVAITRAASATGRSGSPTESRVADAWDDNGQAAVHNLLKLHNHWIAPAIA
jgi:hypothetical protein